MRSGEHRSGAYAEQRCIAKLIDMGFAVSVPVTEERYDILVDFYGEILKVQIKKGWHANGAFKIELRSTSSMPSGAVKKTYTSDEVDAFMFFNDRDNMFYWLWFDEAPATQLNRKVESLDKHRVDKKL